jgi:hypothetical protein
VAQYPRLLPGTDLTLTNGGAPGAMFVALVILFVIALALLGPSFVLLYTLQSRPPCTPTPTTVWPPRPSSPANSAIG